MIFLAAFENFVSRQTTARGHPFEQRPKVSLQLATGVPEGTESGALPKRQNAQVASFFN
jgi:hypothetical protein